MNIKDNFEKYFLAGSLAVVIGFVVVQFMIYNNIKEHTIRDMNVEQMIHAQQASVGIQDYIHNVIGNLNFLSHFPEIITLNDAGKNIMLAYQQLSPDEIKGITRVDVRGKILFTVPDQRSIGMDVSQQEHIRLSMTTHEVVVSDVFTAVQGYRTVAVHVPVFKNGMYDGTVAFLLSFDRIARKYIESIKIGASGFAWVISEKGVEIASPFPHFVGRNVRDSYKEFPEITAMLHDILNGKQGTSTYHYFRRHDEAEEIVQHNAVYKPINLKNTFWSIVITVPEDEVIESLVGLRTTLLLTTLALLTVYVIFMYKVLKAQMFLDEQKKQEALRKERLLLRTIIDNIPDAIYTKDVNSNKTLANKTDVRNMGAGSEEEVLGKDDFAFHPKELAEKFFADDQAVMKSGQPLLFREEYVVNEQGEKKWLLTSKLPLRDEKGQLLGLLGIGHDITDRKRTEEAMKESMEKFRTLFETNPDAIFITDPATLEIHDCNSVACVMNGYTREELIGKSINILHPDEIAKIVEDHEGGRQFVEYLQQHGSVVRESVHKRKDGTLFPIETSMSLLTLEGRTFVMGIDRDITERKRTEKELQEYREGLEVMVKERTAELEVAKERAESADRLKSVFLATMSHELRTPLNSIIGFTGILLKEIAGSVNSEQDKQLSMVKGSALHLLDLINDVLDISKIEAGELVVTMKPFHFGDSMKKVIDTVQPLADKKNLKLRLSVSNEITEMNSDQRRIEQIFINIINNAIKFTERGSVTVECKKVQDYIITKVIDTGIGINKSDMDKLFKPFSQIDTGITRNHEGTGLGLSICARLIKKLGGTISVESTPGAGSTFTVHLPL